MVHILEYAERIDQKWHTEIIKRTCILFLVQNERFCSKYARYIAWSTYYDTSDAACSTYFNLLI